MTRMFISNYLNMTKASQRKPSLSTEPFFLTFLNIGRFHKPCLVVLRLEQLFIMLEIDATPLPIGTPGPLPLKRVIPKRNLHIFQEPNIVIVSPTPFAELNGSPAFSDLLIKMKERKRANDYHHTEVHYEYERYIKYLC
jgi:hypothetical protein